MSTNEFDKNSQLDPTGPSRHDTEFPDDFSLEDAIFAREIGGLFSIDQEEVPPLFVQTLVASDDPRYQPLEHGFEKKTYVRVFRELRLKRRLFHSTPAREDRHWFSNPVKHLLFSTGCAFMFLMVVTVLISGPAFASGWQYLWSGAHSGVVQVHSYPNVARKSSSSSSQNENNSSGKQMSMLDALQLLHFSLYWPQYIPSYYTEDDMSLYQDNQNWADGPIVVLNYSYSFPNHPTHHLAICEFKPQGKVLQVVQDGAAQQIQLAQDGSTSIYIEGHWTPRASNASPYWVYTDRSELIFENKNSGVVFWIVGDKSDGIDRDELLKIQSSLHLFDGDIHPRGHVDMVEQGSDSTSWLFANDVIYLDNPDNPDGPSFKLVGADNASSSPSGGKTTGSAGDQ